MSKPDAIITKMTEAIVKAMQDEPEAWTKPWAGNTELPNNPATGTIYSGGNAFMLMLFSPDSSDPRWSTYKGWEKLGAQVRKGEKGTGILFFNPSWKNDKTGKWSKTMPDAPVKVNKEEGWRQVGVLRGYSVFHASQCDGVEKYEQPEVSDFNVDDHREWFQSAGADWEEKPSDSAYYSPSVDKIVTPEASQFHTVEGWFGTVAHEFTHWTGHSSRLDRAQTHLFDRSGYAFEELVAELGATFLCKMRGVEIETRPDHVRYIKSWLKALDNDPKFIWDAAGKASKAMNYILDNTTDRKEVKV